MKRIICLLCAALLLSLAACGTADPVQSPSESPAAMPSDSPQVSVSPDPTPTPSESAEPPVETQPVTGPVNPLTGEITEKDISTQKPIAIMLNNIKAAMPQQGNSQADII